MGEQQINFHRVEFLLSAFSMAQLPPPHYPEIAFAGRSNVGKSSLMNRLLGRKNLVKTSSRPGKTQSLNYFQVDERLYLVDLPGYGYARVSRTVQQHWERLITEYLRTREQLACVVVLMDIRHPLKQQDGALVEWLHHNKIACLPVYTKADKLSRGQQQQHALALDAGLAIGASDRELVSSQTGQGVQALQSRLAMLAGSW